MRHNFNASDFGKKYLSQCTSTDFAHSFVAAWEDYCTQYGPGSEWIGDIEPFYTSEYEYEYSFVTMSINGDMQKYLEYATDFVNALNLSQYGIQSMIGTIVNSGYDDTNVDILEINISFHIA
jgi:hypothetical protein